MDCRIPVPFPVCLNATSLFATVLYVYGPTKACYDPQIPGCELPENLTTTRGVFPVTVNQVTESGLTGEVLVTNPTQVLPPNATTFVLASTASGIDLGTLQPGSTVVAQSQETMATATLGGAGIRLSNVSVLLKAIPGLDVPNLVLEQVTLLAPLQLSATPSTGSINLDNSRFDGLGTVAMLRHSGQVRCSGQMTCITLEGAERTSVKEKVVREAPAIVISVDELTSVFGQEYILEFFDDERILASVESANLVSSLVPFTIGAVVSVMVAHGDLLLRQSEPSDASDQSE